MKLLRLKPGHGEILLAEGDVEVPEQERELIEAFRRELDAGMWAAVPTAANDGRRQAEMVKSFDEVPRDADRVIFFPRAAGGAPSTGKLVMQGPVWMISLSHEEVEQLSESSAIAATWIPVPGWVRCRHSIP